MEVSVQETILFLGTTGKYQHQGKCIERMFSTIFQPEIVFVSNSK